MINKMPVVGQRYRHLKNSVNYKLAVVDSGDHAICIKLDKKGNVIVPTIYKILTVDKFWQKFRYR